ncbi:MAG: ABC transporter permease [Chloroflexota bacterium]
MTGSRLVRAVIAQARVEIELTLKRGESLLVTIGIPAALLAFFASGTMLPPGQRQIGNLLAASLALAIISTGLVSLGIATAYERYYGVLKRLGSTPMPRGALVVAKLLSVLVLEVAQCIVLTVIAAVVFGWRPHGSLPLVFVVLVLGTWTFAGMGMAMAGALRAEATLAGANGLFLFFLLFGGVYVPLSQPPPTLGAAATFLPSAALTASMRWALTSTTMPASSLLILLLWSIAAPAIAAFFFQWE